MRKLALILAILACAFVIFSLAGCDAGASNPSPTITTPTSYGTNVYYFSIPRDSRGYRYENFGPSLARFLEQHPNLEVAAMASDDSKSFGYTKGYWVVFREKENR